MDYYLITLQALHAFFITIGANGHAEWVAEDIWQWEQSKSVKHHLLAYRGGMGSIFNDFCVDVRNGHSVTHEHAVWANRIFGALTSFLYYFSTKNIKR